MEPTVVLTAVMTVVRVQALKAVLPVQLKVRMKAAIQVLPLAEQVLKQYRQV